MDQLSGSAEGNSYVAMRIHGGRTTTSKPLDRLGLARVEGRVGVAGEYISTAAPGMANFPSLLESMPGALEGLGSCKFKGKQGAALYLLLYLLF